MSAALPPLQSLWMKALLGEEPVHEARSPCAECAMCVPQPGPVFREDVKCCGFEPKLPNWLVGGVLTEGSAKGIRTTRARMAEAGVATPMGLGRSPRYAALYEALDGGAAFGAEPRLACPHLSEGRCTIHAHREATCATWFCRIERGAVGQAVWNAIRDLLKEIEGALARWCIAELGPGFDLETDLEDFYRACWARVSAMEWAEVRAIGGFGLRFRARDLRGLRRERDAAVVPAELRASDFTTTPLESGSVRVWGYGPFNPLDLPGSVAAALKHFDGRPSSDIIDEHPELEDHLQALVDWRVLIPRGD